MSIASTQKAPLRRWHLLIALPACTLAAFLVDLLRGHGYGGVGLPLWLAAGALVAAGVAGFWLLYAAFLRRAAGLTRERALAVDLASYLPFVGLAAYFPASNGGPLNLGTLLLAAALAACAALKVGTLAYYRREQLRAFAASHPYAELGVILGVAAMVRVAPMAANRMIGDEALFSSWGLLIATGKDIFLRTQLVDKPPLLPYLLALSFKLFGQSETAARLPDMIASVAGVAVVYGLARHLFDRPAAALAALLLALSPFDIAYAPTVFTDPLMVALAYASCLLVLKRRYLASGLAIGLAMATKPPAIFFLPLLAFLGVASLWQERRKLLGAALPIGLGVLAVGAPVLFWDVVIRVNSPKILSVQAANYGGFGVAPAGSFVPRLQGWLKLSPAMTGSQPLNLVLAVGVPLLLVYALWRRGRGWAFDCALVAFVLFYLAVHTVLWFQIWDRYLLGLVPVVAILLARVLLLPLRIVPAVGRLGLGRVAYAVVLVAFLGATLAGPAGVAARGVYPVGGDHGLYHGIDQVADYFRANVPARSIVFHKWLGWDFLYYMYGYPYEFWYYPTPEYLLDASRHLADRDKYIVFPSFATDEMAVGDELRAGGWDLREIYRVFREDGSTSYVVYRIEPLQP